MTIEDAIKMLKAKLECMTRDVSGTYDDCNRKLCGECDLCYAQGNMGEQKECLRMAIKALEQESVLDKIRAEIEEKYGDYDICEWYENYDYEENDISEYQQVGKVSEILAIIDKHREESEGEE